jgi:glycosyltransferase involved in cell wall biosynthesis
LKHQGVDVTVRELGFRTTAHQHMLIDYGLEQLAAPSRPLQFVFEGLYAFFSHPILAFQLIQMIARKLIYTPKELLKSLVLVPRSIEIFQEIRRTQPDVVHFFWGHYPTLVAWLIERYLPTQPWSIALNAYDLWMDYPITRAMLPKAGFVRTISQANAKAIDSQAPKALNILTIPRGIDLGIFAKPRENKIKFSFMSAGRMIPKKHIADVVSNFAEFHREHPEAKLALAGDGDERPSLDQQVKTLHLEKSVRFLGHISQRQLAEELARTEVFLFLSEEEMLPNVVKEAMACGCICIARRTDGIEELILHAETGYILDSNHEATNCIRSLFEQSVEDRYIMATRARERILHHFNACDSASQLIDAWENLKSSWRGAP